MPKLSIEKTDPITNSADHSASAQEKPPTFEITHVVCFAVIRDNVPTQKERFSHIARTDPRSLYLSKKSMSALGSPPLENEVLPDYTPSREPCEHLSSLPSNNGRAWLTLRILSDGPAKSKVPVYFNGGAVRGSAQIEFDSPQTLRSVIVEVRGKLNLATTGGYRLLWQESKVLWESNGNHEPKSISKAGKWNWNFNFPIPHPLPHAFDDSPNGGPSSIPLPSSFNLQPYAAFLEYHVSLFVKRGKWLPVDYELRKLFVYEVRERAPPASPLRELAYREQRPPPGPSEDPDGWEQCSEIITKGVLFGDREVNVMYKPYLSKPSIYRRGGTIFYYIEVSSGDSQALQLLSSHTSVSTSLTQEIQGWPFKRAAQGVLGMKEPDLVLLTIAYGTSWISAKFPEIRSEDTRVLEGEISIPSKINQATSMDVLKLRHFVNFAIDAVGFVPQDKSTVVSKYLIRIVTHSAHGTTPISRIPPGYEPPPVPVPRDGTYGVDGLWM